MKIQSTRTVLSAAALALILTSAATAHAAKVLVLANSGNAQVVVTDFAAKTVGHVYTALDVTNATPDLATLNQYEAVLLFENGLFANSTNVGNAVAAYYNQGGKCVVIGTFYWQDRSDNPTYNSVGWGALEAIDVFTAKSGGSEYAPDSMDPASIVAHPVTAGVMTLSAGSYRGGVEAKPNTVVLAKWLTPNKLNTVDPVIGIREDANGGKFVGISIFPNYEGVGNYGVDFNGDFYPLWQNTFSWCGSPCGNGKLDANEACDDGNNVNGDGCTATCKLEVCGDSVVNNGDKEQCDDGNAANTDSCVEGCKNAACGDSFIQDGVEACDDGNNVDDDKCDNKCAPTSCGDKIKQQGEDCDDGNVDNTDDCLDTCVTPNCGDNFVHAGVEACDDANIDNTDDCLDTCVAASCGDGFLQVDVEACDDANADDADGCVTGCALAVCGDGFVYAGIETCDDGNDVDDDDCANDCTVPSGTGTGTDGTGGASVGMTEGSSSDTGDATTTTGEATTGDATTTTGGGTSGGASNSGTGDDTGASPTEGPTTGTSAPDASTSGSTGDGGTDTTGVSDDGCGCSSTTPADNYRGGLLGLLGLGMLARARRRRSTPTSNQ